ncbi:DUF4198 domain-containing protein [Alteromonas antoniana]|uniref:DUF4198 domain-containing protein n=1 Tax=Alteromonas antoniana TaxID=2803813 RepID=UPI001C47DE56|nr:DUF4198 domain-containing protein [Alteromonas antoniana]
MKKIMIPAIALALMTSTASHAHRMWIKPSVTAVSGQDETVTFDAAIANQMFVPDHFAMPLSRISATAPDGTEMELESAHKLRYRSVFDLTLAQSGTYRVGMQSASLRASWKTPDGESHRWPGRGETGDAASLKAALPDNATDVEVVDYYSQANVFVTSGAPSFELLHTKGKGLVLSGGTHPNDVYTGEPATFTFTMGDDVAAGATATLVKGGERYRDTASGDTMTTDADGSLTLTFDDAGMYFLEVEYEDSNAAAPAQQRRGSYVLVFEVLPG